MKNQNQSLSVLYLFIFLLNSNLLCGQVIKMELNELINKSDIIVSGSVTSIESKWEGNSFGKNIYTYVQIKTDDVIKGNLEKNEYIIKILGGVVGDEIQIVTPSVSFNIDEKVILFIDARVNNLVGAFQGKIEINNQLINTQGKSIPKDDFIKRLRDYLIDNNTNLNFDDYPKLKDNTAVNQNNNYNNEQSNVKIKRKLFSRKVSKKMYKKHPKLISAESINN